MLAMSIGLPTRPAKCCDASGPSYFLKLNELDFDQLWTDYLQPLLHDYIQGMPNEKDIMEQFEEAYGYKKPTGDDANGAAKD